MRTASQLRAMVAVALVGLVAAACGSTADLRGRQANGLLKNGNSLAVTGENGAATAGANGANGEAASGNGATLGASGSGGTNASGRAATGAGAAAGVGGASASATGSTGSGSRNAATAPTGSGPVPASGPGVTATKLYVGVGYSSQSAEGDRAIGAGGAAPSYDARDVFNTAINYANSHGGFAGRQAEALYYDYNLTTDFNTQDQSSCAYWTQDHKVFAMGAGSDILKECAEKAGAVPIGGGTSQTFKKFPHLVSPDAMTLDRYAVVTVNGLANANYFSGKLGMVTWDDPDYRYTMTQAYFPTLASHGITPTDTAYIMVPQQIGALGDMTSAVSSAVTKFKAEGIDHVIIQDGHAGVWAGTGLTFEWMNQSKSQQYYPRYGQNAYNSPGWSVLPSDQMDKAVAIDFADDDPKYDEGWHPNPARELCFKIMADAGYPVQSSNQNDEAIAASVCDAVFFLQQVVNQLSNLNSDAFGQKVGQLGTSFQPALVYGSKFSGNRDGGGMVRIEDYSAGCQCLSFRGPPFYGD